MKALFTLFLPLIIASTLVSGCATTPERVGGFNLVSVDQEKQLGDKFAVEIEKEHQVVQDPEVQGYIEGVGKRLLSGVRSVEFPYTFKVVKDETVNAFAVPGGHVYINTGLIKAAGSETELAAVMAHEINHVVARHSTQQMTKQYGYQLLTQLLLGGSQSQTAQLAAELFGKAGGLYYSREMEAQADYLGVETMYKAGYNPRGMATFFDKLNALGEKDPGKLAKFFSSHPQTPDRIRSVQEEIAKLPPKQWLPETTAAFGNVKAKVKAM